MWRNGEHDGISSTPEVLNVDKSPAREKTSTPHHEIAEVMKPYRVALDAMNQGDDDTYYRLIDKLK